jgi:hypothetical protein
MRALLYQRKTGDQLSPELLAFNLYAINNSITSLNKELMKRGESPVIREIQKLFEYVHLKP